MGNQVQLKAGAAQFRPRAAVGLRHGKGEIVYDHAVPFRYLQEALLALDPVTLPAVAATLEKFATRAIITKAENALLNASGLSRKMPADWDELDPLARYKAVGIDLVENT